MHTKPFAFRRADSWLFYALGLASSTGAAALEEVIAAADCVNHAIMTFEEFDSALAKLTAAKFVVINKNGLRLSPAGKRLFVSASMKRNLYAQWQTLHSLLHASEDPANPQWKDPDWSNSYFTAEQFQIAVGTYLNRFRRLK